MVTQKYGLAIKLGLVKGDKRNGTNKLIAAQPSQKKIDKILENSTNIRSESY